MRSGILALVVVLPIFAPPAVADAEAIGTVVAMEAESCAPVFGTAYVSAGTSSAIVTWVVVNTTSTIPYCLIPNSQDWEFPAGSCWTSAPGDIRCFDATENTDISFTLYADGQFHLVWNFFHVPMTLDGTLLRVDT